eukprot:jgi/Ulvmu1/1452/UM011_0182.1
MAGGEYEYDLITLGAGSGGVRASRFASSNYGAKVAVVELPFGFVSSETVGGAGGTCVIRGCVPKKLLVYGSSYSEEFVDAQGFGWEQAQPRFDWNYLVTSKGKEIQRLNNIYKNILKNNGVEHVEGRAYMKDAHTVQVFDADGQMIREMTASNILVAVGGQPHRLGVPGSEHTITSDEALSLSEQPKRIAIIGAGYIAVEFAGIFAGFGSEVHLFYRKDLPLTKFDEECRAMVAENLQRKVSCHPGTNPVSIEKIPSGELQLTYKGSGAEETIMVDQVMMATGRTPNTKKLGLENTGVEMDSKGCVKVDEHLRTSVPHIWALGDVIGRIELTPVALMEGMTFANNCFGEEPRVPDYGSLASAVFCQPPLGTVGFSEEECKSKYSGEMDVFVAKFKPMKNTLSGREERTLMKMIVHKSSEKVLGVHMVGPDAAEIMQGIAIALKAGATKAHFDATIGIHPSSAEEFVTMRKPERTIVGEGTAEP